MANETYTLLIVPHAKARFRKFHVSVKWLKWAGGIAGTGLLVLAFVLAHYVRLRIDSTELRRLRTENSELKISNQKYEVSTGRLLTQVQQLEQTAMKLRVMAGINTGALPGTGTLAGVGGVTSGEASAPLPELPTDTKSLQHMDAKVSSLTDAFAQVEAFYSDQKVLLASTPSVWPVRGYLSASFGNRIDPFTGQKDFHSGIDISTPLGTKVTAPADGIVISVGPKGGYGNAIIVDHGYEIVTRYAHLDAFNVRPGQRVRRGDVLGFVGNTGRSTAPHLHYEVWVRDQAQNSIHFILDEYRSFG
jgi:murein DD-endopeptidase MepM/ murein hydrolase activator NlpD